MDLGSTQTLTNEYQGYLLGDKGGWYVGLTTLPPSGAECLEILGTSTSWSPKDLFRPVLDSLINHLRDSKQQWISLRLCIPTFLA
jgi:hypothetical protein